MHAKDYQLKYIKHITIVAYQNFYFITYDEYLIILALNGISKTTQIFVNLKLEIIYNNKSIFKMNENCNSRQNF